MSTETEKFVKALNELRMTPEERQIKKAEELGLHADGWKLYSEEN